MNRKQSTSQKQSLVKVWKKLFLTVDIWFWPLRRIIFLKSTKMAFCCREIIFTFHVMVWIIPKVCLDSNKHFSNAQRVHKMSKKQPTTQQWILIKVWKKLFLTVDIEFWLLRSMIFLKWTKMALSCRQIIVTSCVML